MKQAREFLNLTQSQKILHHLRKRGGINAVEAVGLYGITRISAVIYNLRKAGHVIRSHYKQGINANYVEYRLHNEE